MNDEPECVCGHMLDEHDRTALAPCLVDGCSCDLFEEAVDDDEERR